MLQELSKRVRTRGERCVERELARFDETKSGSGDGRFRDAPPRDEHVAREPRDGAVLHHNEEGAVHHKYSTKRHRVRRQSLQRTRASERTFDLAEAIGTLDLEVARPPLSLAFRLKRTLRACL